MRLVTGWAFATLCALALSGCVSTPLSDLSGFERVGGADWTIVDGEARASSGASMGFLVSRARYRD